MVYNYPMDRFLVEVPHEESKQACQLAVRTFLETGSHFMTNADWGCADGEHKAWIIVESESKDEVLMIVPPQYRVNAKVVQLVRFSLDDLDETLGPHHQ